MNLSAPSQAFFWVSVVLAVIAIIGALVAVPFVTQYAFWIAILAFIVLAVGCLMRRA